MEFTKVSQKNIHLLDCFIDNLGEAASSFRYFNNRTSATINNHLITLLLIKKANSVAYGHLDFDSPYVWLGVCVLPEFQGHGYGYAMMAQLLDFAKKTKIQKIDLMVDKNNEAAKRLYEKFNFKKVEELKDSYKYRLVYPQ